MPLPISKSQVRKLGDRLCDDEDPSDVDRALLASVLLAYEEALGETEERLASLGLSPNTRLKSIGTILDKLRREPRMKLDAIQDLAGARIVLERGAGREEQDRVRDLVVGAFREGGIAPRVSDRRSEPSQGYRAIHVVTRVAGVPVEIQVRTALQHQWAQYFEKLADQLGRGIRYGKRPERLDALLADGRLVGLRDGMEEMWTNVVGLALQTSSLIAAVETSARGGLGETRQVIERSIDKQLTTTEVVVRELMRRIVEVLAS